MSSLLTKNLPETLHDRLRHRAEKHQRSMNGEVPAILEIELASPGAAARPPPVKGLKAVDGEWTVKVIRAARDGRSSRAPGVS